MSFFSEDRANELKALFFETSQELLQALNDQGLELEQHPEDSETVRAIRRTVHTLKGDSAACGYKDLSELAHELEDVLSPEIAARDSSVTAQVVLTAADVFDSMISAYRGNVSPPSGAALRELIDGLKQQPATPKTPAFSPSFAWTEYERRIVERSINGKPVFNVGIEIDPRCPMLSAGLQLVHNVLKELGTVLVVHPEEGASDAAIRSVEAVIATGGTPEWMAAKCRIPLVVSNVVVRAWQSDTSTTAEQDAPAAPIAADSDPATPSSQNPVTTAEAPVDDSTSAPATSAGSQLETVLRVDAERIDTVLNLVGELVIGKSMLYQAMAEFNLRFPKDPLRAKFADLMTFQAQALSELQRSVMKIRMVPVEQLFRRFPRIVRDVAKIRNRSVVLQMSGQETDLDKSIVDALAEPLAHLVRNAVDHGIEPPDERIRCGKRDEGQVHLNAYHQGNHVVIEVSDDGRGIDPQKVISRAISTGLMTAQQASKLNDSEIQDLIFEPGFSTASEVTEISGRGVGLDVVRTVLERMKGSVAVRSRVGEGTTFVLKVPLTLAIIRALLFRAGERLYAVPLTSVVEIARASQAEIHRVDGREVLQLRDDVLTLIRPGRLGRAADARSRKIFVVVVSVGERKFGFVVDTLVGEEELVIKSLDDHLVSTGMVSGASIRGDGKVVLVLNVGAVVERLVRRDLHASHGELAAINSGVGA